MLKENVLVTGGSGFIGSALKKLPELISLATREYMFHFPTSEELNLLDEKSVEDYFDSFKSANPFTLTIHCAGVTPANWEEQEEGTMFKNVLMFENLRKHTTGSYLVNISSGAALDRAQNIVDTTENFAARIPQDEYGLSKYVIEKGAEDEIELFHLRAFGIFGSAESNSRMIKRNILRYINRENIEIKKDCKIDYFSVYDLVIFLAHVINEKHVDFWCGDIVNLGYGSYTTLGEIARIINTLGPHKVPIEIKDNGWGKSYYGDSDMMRAYSEDEEIELLGLEKSIVKMYKEMTDGS